MKVCVEGWRVEREIDEKRESLGVKCRMKGKCCGNV